MARKDAVKASKIRSDVRRWDDANKRNNAHYHEMTNFVMGQQWEDQEAKLFEDYKKVPITANKLAPMMNHLLGEQRQNTPNLQIEPGDDVDVQAAEVREALVKDISLSTDAMNIYQTAFGQAVIGGFSAYRIGTKYESNDSFDQIIDMGAFKDPTKCFWDLGAEHPCKVDGMYSGFRTTMSRRKFRSIYGKDVERDIGQTSTDVTDTDDITTTFSDENSITVIDIFERESKPSTLYQLSNGISVTKEERKKLQKIDVEGTKFYVYEGEPVTISNEREITLDSIVHSKWGGDYELESTEFPTQELLPVIYVDQHSFWDKNGKQVVRSFFKDAKDTQRFINYLRTQIAYLIKVSRYDQFLVSKQNVKGADTQAMWRDPSTQQGGLWYDESPNGNIPQQLHPPELSQALTIQYESATRDLQMTTGMYDTQMGEQGNEVSGVAVDKRIKAGSYNTYLPRSSLERAITCGGCVINEMIPKVYDSERMMRLNLKSRGITKVTLNKPMDEYGIQTENDMTEGRYKIRLVAGQSYEGQKTEDRVSMDMVLQKNPAAFMSIADLYVESLPMENNIEMRNRLRAMIDPAIIEAGKTGNPLPPKPPQQDPMITVKLQELELKKMTSMIQAQQKAHDLQLKEQKLLLDAHNQGVDFSKELQKIELQKSQLSTQEKEQEMRYNAEIERIKADLHQNHLQNTVKILTHQPNHFKAEKETMNDNTA